MVVYWAAMAAVAIQDKAEVLGVIKALVVVFWVGLALAGMLEMVVMAGPLHPLQQQVLAVVVAVEKVNHQEITQRPEEVVVVE
jgi:hypothetical protein